MKTLDDFDRQFPDDQSCKEYLMQARWPDGVRCPRCSNERVYALKKRPYTWVCKKCDPKSPYRFSLLVGTIFEDTKIPLKKWFKVAYMILQSKKGISALQLHRMLKQSAGSDYRTAWYMAHRIRAAMKNSEWEQLMGEVEIDETGLGGKDKNRHWDKKQHITGMSGKTTVIGAISRKGNVVCEVIENADTRTLNDFVRKTVSGKVDLVATDENRGYYYLNAIGYPHDTVNHGEGEYVRGNVHTNNIEGFWSLLKRGVVGTFHNVSKEYLPLYLNEFTFRHNNRKNPDAFARLISSV